MTQSSSTRRTLEACRHEIVRSKSGATTLGRPAQPHQNVIGAKLLPVVGLAVTLTEAGQRFVPHARKVVRDYQAAMDSVSGIRNKQKGTVVSGMFNSGNDVLAPLIPAFRALYPNINVRLIGSNSAQGADHVRSGRLEAGVVALPIDARGLTISDVLRPVGVYSIGPSS